VTITLSQLINLAVNTVLPILVAIVTSRMASSGLKAIVLLALSAVSGFLTAWLVSLNLGEPFDIGQTLFSVLTGFVVAVAAHFGFWKPVGLTGREGAASKIGA
jgi:hypothetical protein